MKKNDVTFNDDGTVTVSKELYEKYVDAYLWRICLENGGVDNWEQYHESLNEGGYFEDDEQ